MQQGRCILLFSKFSSDHETTTPSNVSKCFSLKINYRFEPYLLDTIYADTELLLKLVDFNVIIHTQMRAIETKRTPMIRTKELLFVVSNTSPKSFNLFLTALVQSNQTNILENMRLIHSEPEDPEAPSAKKQVEMIVDTFQETQSNAMRDKTPPKVTDISPHEDWTYSIVYEEDPYSEYTLDQKSRFCLLVLKKNTTVVQCNIWDYQNHMVTT